MQGSLLHLIHNQCLRLVDTLMLYDYGFTILLNGLFQSLPMSSNSILRRGAACIKGVAYLNNILAFCWRELLTSYMTKNTDMDFWHCICIFFLKPLLTICVPWKEAHILAHAYYYNKRIPQMEAFLLTEFSYQATWALKKTIAL